MANVSAVDIALTSSEALLLGLEAQRKQLEDVSNRVERIAAELEAVCESASVKLSMLDADVAVGELLAVIHGDGGHYQAEHGTAKAAKDAEAKVLADRTALTEAREQLRPENERARSLSVQRRMKAMGVE